VITTSPGSIVKGTVTVEGAAAPSVPPAKIGLGMIPAAAEYVPAVTAYTGGFIDKDWTFEMAGITGSARFILEGAPANWWLKSVSIDFVNAADDPVMFGTRQESRQDVTVVISTNAVGIDGRVLVPRDRKEPRTIYSVAVFPVDSERWYYRSRFTKLTRARQDGGFGVGGLPPGDYWVVAVDSVLDEGQDGDWQNPDVLKNLTSAARRVTLSEGQRSTIELRPASISR
jgi:hypothetical protein